MDVPTDPPDPLPPSKSRPTAAALWWGWASNLLASGIVLVLTLVMGRQMVGWWRPAPRVASVSQFVGNVDAGNPRHVLNWLDFGAANLVARRDQVVGTGTAARDALGAACLDVAKRTPAAAIPNTTAARGFIRGCQRLEPLQMLANGWRLYAIDTPLPMAVVTTGDAAAQPPPSVLAWGVGFPAATDDPAHERAANAAGAPVWTLFSFAPGGAAADAGPQSVLAKLPAPPLGTHVISLYDPGRARQAVYRSRSTAAQCRQFYDDWFRERDWRMEGPSIAISGTARYTRDGHTIELRAWPAAGGETIILVREISGGADHSSTGMRGSDRKSLVVSTRGSSFSRSNMRENQDA